MAKVNQKIKEDLTKLEGLYAKRDAVELLRNNKKAKFLIVFNEATKPIDEAADKKLSPIKSDIAELEKSILAQFETTKQADGTYKLAKVESDKLEIVAESKDSARQVDAKEFYNAVPLEDREKAWDVFNVLIGNAEKLIGKENLNKIAKVTTTWSVKLRKK